MFVSAMANAKSGNIVVDWFIYLWVEGLHKDSGVIGARGASRHRAAADYVLAGVGGHAGKGIGYF